jgi:DNA replication and repair protein RecF
LHIRHLSLSNFRNYARLELDLPTGISVFYGDNAQGKTNLLESIYVLATSKSPRTSSDGELISWPALREDMPVCRIAAQVDKGGRTHTVEIALMARTGHRQREHPASVKPLTPKAPTAHKRVRLDGAPKRAADLIGQIKAVVFTVHDIDIVSGEPALRRRYLDATISQLDRHYLRHLQRYNKVLSQRNRLLYRIAEGEAHQEELAFWDKELTQSGSYLVMQRAHAVAALENLAQPTHAELSSEEAALRMMYVRSIGARDRAEVDTEDTVAAPFHEALRAFRGKELAQKATLVGPHRDELRFLSNGIDVGTYSSRGQQRTVALALKLAQARFILDETGEHPILLLDDVLSELDAQRRAHLLSSIREYHQVLMTATELDHFDVGFLSKANVCEVKDGHVERTSA